MRVSQVVFEMPCLQGQHGAMLLPQGDVRRLREGKKAGCNWGRWGARQGG